MWVANDYSASKANLISKRTILKSHIIVDSKKKENKRIGSGFGNGVVVEIAWKEARQVIH